MSTFPGDNLLLDYDWTEIFENIMAQDTGNGAAKAAMSVTSSYRSENLGSESARKQVIFDAYGITVAEMAELSDLLTRHYREPDAETTARLRIAWADFTDTMEYYMGLTEVVE